MGAEYTGNDGPVLRVQLELRVRPVVVQGALVVVVVVVAWKVHIGNA